MFCYEGKAHIVQKNMKSSVRNAAQNVQHEKWSRTAPEISIYLALWSEMRKVTTFQQYWCHGGCCCAMHVLTVHSSQCHLPWWKISQTPTSWARSLNIYGRCSLLFPPTLHAAFAKHPKRRNTKAENGLIFGREKNKTSDFEMWLTKAHKKLFEPGRLNGVFLRGHVDPSYLYLISLF